MSGHFVIDINVGAQREPQRPQQTAALAGFAASQATSLQRRLGGVSDLSIGDLGETRSGNERYSKHKLQEVRNFGMRLEKGKLETPFTRTYHDADMPDLDYGVETTLGFGVRKVRQYAIQNKTGIKALGAATAYKSVNAAMDLQAYTSGDQVANEQRQRAARVVGYGAAIAMAGPKAPIVAAAIIGNEAINAFVDARKFNYDRKMERSQLTNSEIVLGDISYGRRRGGR